VLQEDLTLDPALDRDTQGVPGAPAVAETIIQKINQACVFVADVSIINPEDKVVEGKRLTSNPNVLFELGYAVALLDWESIILVHNLATGVIEDLRFDIRSRRPLTYSACENESDRSKERLRLQRSLQDAISACITARQNKQPNVRLFFKPSPGRFGVENRGTRPITVVRFDYELPQTIHVNSGSPIEHPPIVRVANAGLKDGIQYWRMTLIRSNSGPVPGVHLNWELPELIAAGESEVFQYPASFIKDNAPRNAQISLKLTLDDGTVMKKTPTIGELFDQDGEYVLKQS
jgi:hypothetical protein